MVKVNSETGRAALPRLLYLGEPPVEAAGGGALLLYRLLLAYPPDRLRVVESNLHGSVPSRRLPQVNYGTLWFGWRRLLQTRLAGVYSAWLILTSARRAGQALRRAGDFRPEAVLAVAHGFGWIAAAAAAAKLRVPLHLIVHDDWPTFVAVPARLRPWIERTFRRLYRQAASRLCVSPAMAEEYERRFGVPGTVLYPGRAPAADQETASGGLIRTAAAPARPFTFGYAGAVASASYEQALLHAAEALAACGGRLLVYSPSALRPVFGAEIKRRALPVDWRAALPSEEVIRILRAEADALFVPMSFSPAEAANTRLSFPSKLTDYTRAGLPLLIYGPEECSAVRWARENPLAALVVAERSAPALAAAIGQLARDPAQRLRLAEGGANAGTQYFSYARTSAIFLEAVSRPAQDAARRTAN